MEPRIRLENVSIAYSRNLAVKDISGSFEAGSLTAIAGPNGAGKSTLLKALMGDLKLQSGAIHIDALQPKDFGYLPQAAEIDRHFPLSVADTVMLGAWNRSGAFRGISQEAAERGQSALEAVGLGGFERRHIGSLSAGQFQRVLFARLLLQDAKVIVLDEPFTAIDAATTRDLLAIIHRWNDDGRTIIAVLHDFEQVRSHFPRTLLMARETISWGPTETTMTTSNLQKARAMAENAASEQPERLAG
ncbi:metal ABC transporter ATP-binding protein [Rhizobium sp. HT1-10]